MLGIRLFLMRFGLILAAGLYWQALAQKPVVADPIQQALKDGDSAYAGGDYESARKAFEKAWQIAQSLPGSAPVRYEVLKRVTAASAASGQFAEAGRYLRQALGEMAPNDSRILDDLLLSINLDLRTKNTDQALATAQRVQGMHIATYTAESLPVADDFLRIGQINLAQGHPREAVRAFSKAHSLRNKIGWLLDPGLLPVLDGLNDAFRAIAGESGTGVTTFYRQALAIRETLYGPDSGQIGFTLDGSLTLVARRGVCRYRTDVRAASPCGEGGGKIIPWSP